MSVENILRRDNEYLVTLARVREEQWQKALRQQVVMRAELVRLGVTDPAVLGPELLTVRGVRVGGGLTNGTALPAADEPVVVGGVSSPPAAVTPVAPGSLNLDLAAAIAEARAANS